MKKNDKPLVSVIIISYKQAKYIREAIDSVLMQKVYFKYELILADDCSKDGTFEIMKEYEKKHSDVIKVLKREKNLGAHLNCSDAYSHAGGKYLTVLEGDDYWIDDNKLQMQVDFLEKNNDFFAITHIQEGRNLNNEIKGYFPKPLKEDIIICGVEDFIKNGKDFSCSAILYRNFYNDALKVKEISDLKKFDSLVGDAQSNIFFARQGKIYISKKPMMVYRMRNNDGESNFNSSHKVNEIEYRYLNIYAKIEEYYDNQYCLFKMIKKCYTLGVAYNICTFNFKDIKNFNKICPKKYKFRIWISFPLTCISILYRRFIIK